MGRKKKVKSEAPIISDYYWHSETEEAGKTIELVTVYTENSEVKAKMRTPNALYYNGKNGVHYVMVKGSEEQKKIFKWLGLTKANEYNAPVRKKRKKKGE